MNKKINLALQMLPKSDNKSSYDMIDEIIAVIKSSGIKHRVCPFETVMEGTWDELMNVVRKVHEIAYLKGANEIMTYIKIQSDNHKDVTIEDKMENYD